METIICNDFSLHMLTHDCNVNIKKISLKDFNEIIDNDEYISCIGNNIIATVFGLKFNKSNIQLDKENTRLIVVKIIKGDFTSEIATISTDNFEFYSIEYCGKC